MKFGCSLGSHRAQDSWLRQEVECGHWVPWGQYEPEVCEHNSWCFIKLVKWHFPHHLTLSAPSLVSFGNPPKHPKHLSVSWVIVAHQQPWEAKFISHLGKLSPSRRPSGKAEMAVGPIPVILLSSRDLLTGQVRESSPFRIEKPGSLFSRPLQQQLGLFSLLNWLGSTSPKSPFPLCPKQ